MKKWRHIAEGWHVGCNTDSTGDRSHDSPFLGCLKVGTVQIPTREDKQIQKETIEFKDGWSLLV